MPLSGGYYYPGINSLTPTRVYTEEVVNKDLFSNNRNFKLNSDIGFSGRNRIIAILEIAHSGEKSSSKVIVHYGSFDDNRFKDDFVKNLSHLIGSDFEVLEK